MNWEIRGLPSFGAIADIAGVPRQKFSGVAKLTENEVIAIRGAYKLGEEIKDIANDYNVSRQTIHNIVNGDTWKNV